MAIFVRLLFLLGSCWTVRVPFNDELLLRTRVKMNPMKEKVIEGAQALFICHVTSLEADAHVTWIHNGKLINGNDDGILVETRAADKRPEVISDIHTTVSVLRIEKTSKRHHKGKYTCQVYHGGLGATTSTSAALFIMKDRGLPALKFAHLPPENIVVEPDTPIRYRAPVEMPCNAYYNDEEVRERGGTVWIKNSTYEIFGTRGFRSGRIIVSISKYCRLDVTCPVKVYDPVVTTTITEASRIHPIQTGSMEIRQPEPSDSGVYECVAKKNKQLIVSHKVNLIVQKREVRTNCTDQDGTVVPIGDEYHPYTSDPCTVCMCVEDPYLMSCSNEACSSPSCNNYVMVNGSCCEYTCLDETTSECLDISGDVVEVGQLYHPDPDDPCTVCECLANPDAMSCSNEACEEPACRNYRIQPGTCCGYVCPDGGGNETCTDFNGLQFSTGEMFHPFAESPCSICVCTPGPNPMAMACSNEGCDMPNCTSYQWVDGACCEHVCVDNLETVGVDVRQLGSDAVMVQWDPLPTELPNAQLPIHALMQYNYKRLTVRYWDRFALDMSSSFKMVNVTNNHGAAIIRGLSPNTMYEAHLQGTNLDDLDFVGYARFSIHLSSGNSLRLTNDNHPDVRLKINGEDPVPIGGVMYFNVANFDYVLEGTFPCEETHHCHSLEFHRYGVQDVQTLQFYSLKDYIWARAHL